MPSQQLTFRPNKKNHTLLYKPFDKSVGVNTSHKSQQLCRWLNHKPAARRGPGTLHVATVTASLGLHCAVRTALVCCESKNTRETTATLKDKEGDIELKTTVLMDFLAFFFHSSY